jgi:hypothetical protein
MVLSFLALGADRAATCLYIRDYLIDYIAQQEQAHGGFTHRISGQLNAADDGDDG